MTGPDEATEAPTDAKPIDRAKVRRLQRAIDAGEYAINVEEIADKLLVTGFPVVVNPE